MAGIGLCRSFPRIGSFSGALSGWSCKGAAAPVSSVWMGASIQDGSVFSQNNRLTGWTTRRSYSETSGRNVQEEISKLVTQDKVVIFMKGVPDAPRCGFSNAVVQIMRMHDVKFEAHNVLDDEDLRQGIKEFSSWPTIPQVYFSGEFIGGCDILLQMHQSGELVEELEKIGIKSALLPSDDKSN